MPTASIENNRAVECKHIVCSIWDTIILHGKVCTSHKYLLVCEGVVGRCVTNVEAYARDHCRVAKSGISELGGGVNSLTPTVAIIAVHRSAIRC